MTITSCVPDAHGRRTLAPLRAAARLGGFAPRRGERGACRSVTVAVGGGARSSAAHRRGPVAEEPAAGTELDQLPAAAGAGGAVGFPVKDTYVVAPALQNDQ